MLEWHLKYGEKFEFFENLDAEGHPVDEFPAMLNRPSLYGDLYDDWNIFWKLSGKRRIDVMSGRVGQIPYPEIESYMRIHKIDGEIERERLVERIEFMDKIFCNFHNEKVK